MLDVDLHAVLTLARVAIPALLRRPQPRIGRFVAVARAAATRGLPLLAAYCAAKAGVAGLVRALAVELGRTGVTANAVSPGSTDTPILAESARLYGLDSAAGLRPPAAVRPAARPGRGRRRAGLAGRRPAAAGSPARSCPSTAASPSSQPGSGGSGRGRRGYAPAGVGSDRRGDEHRWMPGRSCC